MFNQTFNQKRNTTPVAVASALLLFAGLVFASRSAHAQAYSQICGDHQSSNQTRSVAGGKFIVMNNKWNPSGAWQCITTRDDGFVYDSGYHNVPTNGPPASYPGIYVGCHYGICSSSANSGLPKQVSALNNPTSSVSFTPPSGGEWDASYDLWFDTNPYPAGQNNGAEIMIWPNHAGRPQPAGQQEATVQIGGAMWNVWKGRLTNGSISWNVISYVRQAPVNSISVNIKDFINDAVSRGHMQSSWYMTSVQFGFEPWIGGPGLNVSNFTYDPGTTGNAVGLINLNSGKALDTWSTNNGSELQQWDYWATDNQKWYITRGRLPDTWEVKSKFSGKCLSVPASSTTPGIRLNQWDCYGGTEQLWYQVWSNAQNFQLVNVNSTQCLDVSYGSGANGAAIIQWTCHTGNSQRWSTRP
ncbi:GH12 family glycosyl hydrolase domain-containing protein [Pseudoxanthomonas sacheonensis]|uniref:Endoglucanase n=1 Tax=Pseudoxanthomonas sacheonensis TaxID=443615 RepID=A0ABU1RYK0_9GAMM|nr:RICIN domain-containing protein [Pseudoxanthomonas sacheonensis]MDR6843214.1 endoglucanase [Pseudoxanthomonas sacheonensis]